MKLEINPLDYEFVFQMMSLPYFHNIFFNKGAYRDADSIITYYDNTWKYYIAYRDRDRLADIGLNMLEHGMVQFRKKIHRILNSAKIFFPEIEKTDFSKFSDKEFIKELERFIKLFQQLGDIFSYTEYFMFYKAQEKIQKLVSNETLISSPKETVLSREFYDKCKLALNQSKKALLEHVKKYSYINYNEGGKTLTLSILKKELKQIKNPNKEIDLIDKKHKEILSKREKSALADAIREMSELKFLIRCYINKTVFGERLINKYLAEISRRTGVENPEEYHYTETIDLLSKKKVKKASRKLFVLGKFNNWKLIEKKQAFVLIKELDKLTEVKTTELKGYVGNKGYYVGKAKLLPMDTNVDLAKEIDKMDKGDVLVTISTGPEMIKACHKAGAIVTEEGGVCAHAAIVSRELGIPSVLATKVATKVFKDGDMVEVDANNGIVRKLK